MKIIKGIRTLSSVIGGFFIGVMLMVSPGCPSEEQNLSSFDHILTWQTLNLPDNSKAYVSSTNGGYFVYSHYSAPLVYISDPEHKMFREGIK